LEFASDDGVAARMLETLYHAAPATTAAPDLRYAIRRVSPAPGSGYEAASPSHPVFGPTTLADAWAFLEWRATEDLVNHAGGPAVFLHAAGAVVGGRLVLMIGDSGSGKSTLVMHLMLRGHRILGDDLVRFASLEGSFSAVGRSIKLDPSTLCDMPLVAALCASATTGTLLAAGCYYVSPAAIRRDWEAPAARPWAVVLLDAAAHRGAGAVTASSEGEAAVYVTQQVIAGSALEARTRERAAVRLLESLADTAAYRATGNDPAAIAAALEREASK
jgi:hypothetical protein